MKESGVDSARNKAPGDWFESPLGSRVLRDEAALTRLRPILMTTAATICGHFPLTLVTGAGAAARNSIGITIVAGMFFGTIFTLLVIPAIYVLIAKQHNHDEEVG